MSIEKKQARLAIIKAIVFAIGIFTFAYLIHSWFQWLRNDVPSHHILDCNQILEWLQKILAPLSVALFVAFLLRNPEVWIAKFYKAIDHTKLHFKMPAMLGCAPILHAIREELWARHRLMARLDWTFSSTTALKRLHVQENFLGAEGIGLTIATDFAVACHLKDKDQGQLHILPFAILERPIYEISLADVGTARHGMAYKPGSIEEDYILKHTGRSDKAPIAIDDLFDKVASLHQNIAESFLAWDPYHFAFMLREDNEPPSGVLPDLVVTPGDENYRTVLCLIAPKLSGGLETNTKVLKQIGDVIEQCCSNLDMDSSELYRHIAPLFPEEAMGIPRFDETLHTEFCKTSYIFGVQGKGKAVDAFVERVYEISDTPGTEQLQSGIGSLKTRFGSDDLWPGVSVIESDAYQDLKE